MLLEYQETTLGVLENDRERGTIDHLEYLIISRNLKNGFEVHFAVPGYVKQLLPKTCDLIDIGNELVKAVRFPYKLNEPFVALQF